MFFSPARCILTATGVPLYTARCTCPSEAPASGVSSNESNGSGVPSSASSSSRTRDPDTHGTAVCSDSSASQYAGCSRSLREEKTCPSLIIVGPRLSRPSRTHAAVMLVRSSSSVMLARTVFQVATKKKRCSARERRKDARFVPPRSLSHLASSSSPSNNCSGSASIAGVGDALVGTTTPSAPAVIEPSPKVGEVLIAEEASSSAIAASITKGMPSPGRAQRDVRRGHAWRPTPLGSVNEEQRASAASIALGPICKRDLAREGCRR
eukprot:7232512-Prymnesium_polylepis.2